MLALTSIRESDDSIISTNSSQRYRGASHRVPSNSSTATSTIGQVRSENEIVMTLQSLDRGVVPRVPAERDQNSIIHPHIYVSVHTRVNGIRIIP